jgi:hypothetical protein
MLLLNAFLVLLERRRFFLAPALALTVRQGHPVLPSERSCALFALVENFPRASMKLAANLALLVHINRARVLRFAFCAHREHFPSPTLPVVLNVLSKQFLLCRVLENALYAMSHIHPTLNKLRVNVVQGNISILWLKIVLVVF